MKVYLAMTLLIVLILSSCKAELRDLCYDHNHWNNVDIRFDWQHAPGADAKGMSVLFYNQQEPGREAERYEFIGHQGGQARLLPGTWQAIAYNNDTEAILYRGSESINTLEAYTRESSIEEGTQLTRAGMPRATGTEDEPVILEPDPLWGVASEPIVTNTEKKDVALTLLPTARAHRMTITIHNVPNLQYTKGVAGSITGLAPGVNMLTGEPLEGCATEAFVGSVIDETTLQMHLMTFGHCPHETAGSIHAHKLVIYAILNVALIVAGFFQEDIAKELLKDGDFIPTLIVSIIPIYPEKFVDMLPILVPMVCAVFTSILFACLIGRARREVGAAAASQMRY